MSVAATSAVWDHSESRGNARLVLLKIADNADETGIAWPTYELIAAKCGMSVRSAIDNVSALVALGELVVAKAHRRPNIYRITLGDLPARHDKAHEAKGFECKFCTQAAGDPAFRVQIPDADLHTNRKEPPGKSSSAVADGEAARIATTNGRKLSPSEAFADQALLQLEPLLVQGKAFDLTREVGQVFTDAWQRAAADPELNPKAVAQRIAGVFYETVTGERPEYGRIGRLVSLYGKLALFGIAEAVARDVDDPYTYAGQVCKGKIRDLRAEQRARAETA